MVGRRRAQGEMNMLGRRRSDGELRRGARWFAVSAGLAVAAAASAVAMAPAEATPVRTDSCGTLGGIPLIGGMLGCTTTATTAASSSSGTASTPVSTSATSGSTITAQLSLSGVATQSNMLGGTTVGVHPGDTVVFEAAALPTAGLDNIPTLGSTLDSLLQPLLGGQYQVQLNLGSTFPGGARSITVGGPTSGACKGVPSVPVTFPTAGTYSFTWNAQYVLPSLLGCSATGLNSTSLNLLKSAGVALNAYNQWTGQIVVADNPPSGGISIQLPGLGVAPSLPGVGQLPSMGIPPISLPTIPAQIPGLPGLPGGTSNGPGGGSSTAPAQGPGRDIGGIQVTIPDLVVPKGPGVSVPGVNGWQVPLPGKLNPAAHANRSSSAAPAPFGDLPTAAAPDKTNSIELSANSPSSPQMPVILAILAIIALAVVTAIYARLYLLRKA